MRGPQSSKGVLAASKRKYTRQRSRKVCEHCHSRKIKCDVLDKGIPCTNCASYQCPCAVRRRKNRRRDATPSDDEQDSLPKSRASIGTGAVNVADPSDDRLLEQHVPEASLIHDSALNGGPQDSVIETQPNNWWDQTSLGPFAGSVSSTNDFSHLTDLDDIFTFTGNMVLPVPPDEQQGGYFQTFPDESTDVLLRELTFLRDDDREYLRSQGCFGLPATNDFRQLMTLFFKFCHPHLPLVIEDQFWSSWTGNMFHTGSYSVLLVRAMMFAAIEYASPQLLASIGFHNARDARAMYYRQAKLLFDFGVEQDPVRNAQSCLLLTYHSPNYNLLRVNTGWLVLAIRFAKIARADSFYQSQEVDPDRAKLLKRLWWCIMFRDRIISLGLRRSVQVDIPQHSVWQSEESILRVDDFHSEFGNSPIYDTDTQLRIIELLGAMCKFMQRVLRSLKVLYSHERISDRLATASGNHLSATIAEIRDSEEALQEWYDETLPKWPFPVSLGGDEIPDSICLYVNMLFSYHAVVTFALNTYLIVLYEICPGSRSLINREEAIEALEESNEDITRRVQEVLQVRLVKYLPISVTPLIAPPLVLQAINVAAARSQNPRTEASEVRKLDIFTRTLKSQQQRFEGCDYCEEVLTNIINYVQDDGKLISSMSNWRGERQMPETQKQAPEPIGSNRIRLDWTKLVDKRPRLFLRLMLHLDHSLCTGGPPLETDFIPELRRETM